MSNKGAKKQGLSLNDVSQQVIALSSSNKDGLGPLLTGTLYEALSSTLVDIEEQPGDQGGKIQVILSNNTSSVAATPNLVDVSVTFLTAVVSAGPTGPTTVLLCRLLSYLVVDAKNVATWSMAVKSLVKVMSSKDVAASRVYVQCLCLLVGPKVYILTAIIGEKVLLWSVWELC